MEGASLKFIGVGITMLGAAIGAGYGLGTVFSTWLSSIARNPEAENKMKLVGFIGFAGNELVLLMGFVIAALLIFAA